MRIKRFDDLAREAKEKKQKTVVAVVEAHDEHTLKSVIHASSEGIITPMLIGNRTKIHTLLESLSVESGTFQIVDSDSTEQSLTTAVEAISKGDAGAIMKGRLESGEFLKTILRSENGLIGAGTLSIAGLFEIPGYRKIIAVSDMALNTYPDLACKRAIIENGVGMLHALGIENPKVAVLAAVEKLNPKMPETVDADALKTMNQQGEIKDCVIEGPISFDLATEPEAAEIKGYKSPVAGDADLLIVPDIVCGNVLAKSLTGMARARTAGTVLGAKIPVILTSRSAEADDKFYSIALAACIAGKEQNQHG